jgi:membrane protease YdiL (CAAX protease family)
MKYVAWFLAIVFGVTWGLCLLLRMRAASGDLAIMLAWALPTVWSPTVAALLLTGLSEGSTGVRRELRRVTYRRGSGKWLAIAAAVPIATVLTAVLVSRAAGHAAPFTSAGQLPFMVGLELVAGPVAEELGWRGFLFPRLQRQFGTIAGAWVMALLWSLWHVAGIFFPGTPLQVAPIALFLTTVVLMGVFLAFVFDRTSGSVLPSMIAHLCLNVTLGLGGAPPSSLALWWTMVSMLGVAALIATFVWAKAAAQRPDFAATS